MYGAALHRTVKVVELLLKRGAAAGTPINNSSLSPLGTAAYEGHVKVARALVRAGADPFERLGSREQLKSPNEIAEERGHKGRGRRDDPGWHPALIPFLTIHGSLGG